MAWDAVSAVAALLSVIVVTVGAVVAYQQLKHMRRSLQLQGFLEIARELDSPDYLEARDFVRNRLSASLRDAEFREDLRIARLTSEHRELRIANYFDKVGMLMKHGVLDGDLFFQEFRYECPVAWEQIKPAIDLVRERQPLAWQNFEYLARYCERRNVADTEG